VCGYQWPRNEPQQSNHDCTFYLGKEVERLQDQQGSDTLLILSTLKYALSKGDQRRDTTADSLLTVLHKANWTGKRFILTEDQRTTLKLEVPPAYWLGAINDNLEVE
jgi:hypothetical protein